MINAGSMRATGAGIGPLEDYRRGLLRMSSRRFAADAASQMREQVDRGNVIAGWRRGFARGFDTCIPAVENESRWNNKRIS
jgi:hypothetical protein